MDERRQPTSDDLVRSVIGMIASRNGESMDFNRLQRKLNIDCRNELLDCLRDNPDSFEVHHKVVYLIVPVKLCPDYCSESNCHDRNCPMFHICKFYILSNRCLSKKNSCKYGHDLDSHHNSKLLRSLLLDELSLPHLRRLFQLPNNRTEASIPRICSFYNVKTGCSKRGKCTSLHICEHYIWSNCKFGRSKCNRSHDILDNEKILQRFGMNTAMAPSAILKEIKAMYDMIEERNKQNVDSDSEIEDEEPRNSFHSPLEKYTPRSEIPDIFKMTFSEQVEATGLSSLGQTNTRRQEQQPKLQARSTFTQPRSQPIQPLCQRIRPSNHLNQHFQKQIRSAVINPAVNPLQYTVSKPLQTIHRSRHRHNSASSDARYMRSKSQHPENRKLYSQFRRFGSTANISTQPKEPVICQYYMDGYCRFKNHCRNIHPPKDDLESSESDNSDSEGQEESEESEESDN